MVSLATAIFPTTVATLGDAEFRGVKFIMSMFNRYVQNAFRENREVFEAMSNNELLIGRLVSLAALCVSTLRSGGKLIFAGNGGSAADAQHIAAEFVSRFDFDRPGLAAIALTTDSSILTAVGNDYGFERLFSRQISSIGRPEDVFIAYTTSGQSKNILFALDEANRIGLSTVVFTGNRGGEILDKAKLILEVNSSYTPRIQEAHGFLGHLLCGMIENTLFSTDDAWRP